MLNQCMIKLKSFFVQLSNAKCKLGLFKDLRSKPRSSEMRNSSKKNKDFSKKRKKPNKRKKRKEKKPRKLLLKIMLDQLPSQIQARVLPGMPLNLQNQTCFLRETILTMTSSLFSCIFGKLPVALIRSRWWRFFASREFKERISNSISTQFKHNSWHT